MRLAQKWGSTESYLTVEESRLTKGRGDQAKAAALRHQADKQLGELEKAIFALESAAYREGQEDAVPEDGRT